MQKRIIALGEENHRVETYSAYKSELVKILHKNYDFDIIVFESSILACENAYTNIDSDTIALKEALYGVWHSKSVLDLFHYINKNKQSETPLVLLGFDFKGGSLNSTKQSKWLGDLFSIINPAFGLEIYKTDSLIMHVLNVWELSGGKKTISSEQQDYFNIFYSTALTILNNSKPEFIEKNGLTSIQYQVIKKSLENRMYLAKFLALLNLPDCLIYRDKIMSENMRWIAEELYPDKKIIFWAADLHLMKHYENKHNTTYKPSGTLLPQQMKDKMAVISLTKYDYAKKENKKSLKKFPGNVLFLRPEKGTDLSKSFEGVLYFKKVESTKNYMVK